MLYIRRKKLYIHTHLYTADTENHVRVQHCLSERRYRILCTVARIDDFLRLSESVPYHSSSPVYIGRVNEVSRKFGKLY